LLWIWPGLCDFFFHFFVADIDNSDNYWEKEN